MTHNKLIWEKKNALNSEFCKDVINMFEKDERKSPGVTTNGLDDSKKTTDLMLSSFDDWKRHDTIFFENLNSNIEEYQNYLKSIHPSLFIPPRGLQEFSDSGYQIQKYDVKKEGQTGGYFNWHSDFNFRLSDYGVRVLTFMWYLNSVSEGGETEFIGGTKIVPETGKMVIFPSNWDMIHRGIEPISNDKYICTGWLYMK